LTGLGSTPIKKNILSNFVSDLSSELLRIKDDKGNVSMGVLASLIRLKIQKDAFQSKNNGNVINEILSTLYTKRRALNKLKKERIRILKGRSNRRLKALYTLIGF
jgi:predicted transcriptional regulator